MVDVTGPGDVHRPLVVRTEAGGSFTGTEINVQKEATVYRALGATAVPVPRVLGVAPGGTAILMERVRGDADLEPLPDESRQRVLEAFVDVVGDLHNIPADHLDLPGFPRPSTAEEHATLDLASWERLGRAADLDPLVRYAGAFLRHHPPTGVSRTVLVQGDTGPGNFLFDGDVVTALVDMEFAHLGDPMDDIAWILYRAPEAEGKLERLLARYTARTGIPIDERSVDYYRVAVQYRCAVTTSLAVARGGGARGWAPYLLTTERYHLGVAAALSSYVGVTELSPDIPDPAPTSRTPLFDQLLEGVRAAVRNLDDPALKESTRNLQILVHFLRSHDRAGRELAQDDAADLADLGLSRDDPAALASAAEESGAVADEAVLRYLLRRSQRQAALWRTLLERPRR